MAPPGRALDAGHRHVAGTPVVEPGPCSALQRQLALRERHQRGNRHQQNRSEQHPLPTREHPLAALAPGQREQHHAGYVQQYRQQQVVEAAGIHQPQRIGTGQQCDAEIAPAHARLACVGVPAPGQLHAERGGQEIRHQAHRRGQQHQPGVAARIDQHQQQEQLDQAVAQPERVGGHAACVFAAQERRHGAVARCGIQHFGTQQHPGQQRTEYGNDRTDDDHRGPPLADDGTQHVGHRRIGQPGQFSLRQHAHRQQADQYQQQPDTEEADHRGAADVGAAGGTPRVDAGALDADEHPHGDQHHAAQLLAEVAECRRAEEIRAEHIEAECACREHQEQRDRQQFGHGHQAIDDGRGAQATQHQ
ncbi:hypothetical protein G6F31_014124 [Rhizopus arrhizus]|nr:hypothetical protein G6F31_014124 [Rhizopus arrhizus]